MNRKRAFAVTLHANRVGLAAAALLTLAVLMALLSVRPAAASNGYDPRYRFCVAGVSTGFGADIPDCAYNTWQECQFSANGRGYCIENPAYAARPQRTYR